MPTPIPYTPEQAPRLEDVPEVLLIDDCIDVYRLLGARLRSETMHLSYSDSGSDGLKQARETSPALVLLDIEMPGIDGFEVLRGLKSDPVTLNIPVIVLSGLNSPHDKVTAFDLGAIDYITKPFELTELRVRVRSALRLYRLMAMLAQRAQIDGLTGLWNRTYFSERLASEVARAGRHNRPLSLAVMDIDHFKSINDTYGHPAGDSVIQGLAEMLQTTSRADDVACRYGGEEFALIMPDTTVEDALGVCERIRNTFEAKTWPRHPGRHCTLSCGIAGSNGGASLPPDQWLETADKQLYASKQGGRNRTSTADLGVRMSRSEQAA